MPIAQILDLLRTELAPELAWRRVLEICKLHHASALWETLPAVDIDGDAEAIRGWLATSLEGVAGPVGLCLGLDTLNMRDGAGTNLELGWKRACAAGSDDIGWVFERLEHGSSTLIVGLVALQAEYRQDRWNELSGMADHVLSLAYSGVVLAQALRHLERQDPLLAAWGFHDGDLFALCRCSAGTFEMICR